MVLFLQTKVMHMSVAKLLYWEMLGFLVGLVCLLAWRMLTGQMALRGLLMRKDGRGQRVSPERVPLLLATLGLSGYVLVQVFEGGLRSFPDVGWQWVAVFGGSSGLYAGVKALTTLRRKV